jgi:hypothetical protein
MRISVVGNAKSIFKHEHGELIDSADLVIRFNRGAPIKPKSQGTKTNILVFTNPGSKNAFKEELIYWDTKNFNERFILEQELNAPPSNGIVALEKVKNDYPDATVQIFGFDWKETETFWRPDRPTTKHNYDNEKLYCLRLIDEMGWELHV